MMNKEIKEQETTAQCAICIVMRCAYKWMLAAGVIGLIGLLIAVILSWCITGEDEAGRWSEIWMMATLIELILSVLAAIATHWKEVYEWVRDELRCA